MRLETVRLGVLISNESTISRVTTGKYMHTPRGIFEFRYFFSSHVAGADGEVVIRRLRLGSVLRMAFGFSLCAVIVVVGAGVLIWITISTLGVVENLESLAEDLGWVDVTFDGPAMLRAALIGGGILVVAASLLSVVFAEVFNLLSTITGGLKAEVGPAPLTRRERRRIHKALKRRAREQASAA